MPTFGRAARSTTATFNPSSTAAAASGRPGNGPVVVSLVLSLEIFSVVLLSSTTWESWGEN